MRHLIGAALALALAGCASGYGSGPPGGPVDRIPPKILGIVPDTNATNVTQRALTIHFDKVVSERPAASQATTLRDLVIVSPRDGKPNVDWHRHDLVIHPDHGWRANTAYTVTILPGIADLRGNVMRKTTSITFSTGSAIPATTVSGTIFDALRGTPEAGALIEAVARTDTMLVYVTAADSTGRFTMRGVAPGTYLIRGYVDQNHNNGLDPIEAYDTTTVTLRDSTRTEFLTFVHDTIGPRLGMVDMMDSLVVRASFDTPLTPTQRLDTTSFMLLASDSSRVPIVSVAAVREDTIGQSHDTTTKPRIDTTAVPPDSADTVVRIPRVVMPKPTRQLLIHTVLITLRTPLRPKAEYRLRAINIWGANGRVKSSDHPFSTPAPPPPPTVHDTAGKARAAPRAP